MINPYIARRIRAWLRSPNFYFKRVKDRLFGMDTSFTEKARNDFEPGSMEWLALTELNYGGLQKGGAATKVNQGGDRMHPLHHGYGSAYAEFLKPWIGRNVNLIEIGILNGTGLAIWCDLFPASRVIGMDIDLENFRANLLELERLGAFSKTRPELHEFNQLDLGMARQALAAALGDERLDIVIDDGCHSIESIEITFQAVQPHLSSEFVYFIEDNFDTYDRLAKRYPNYNWASRGEITIARNR